MMAFRRASLGYGGGFGALHAGGLPDDQQKLTKEGMTEYKAGHYAPRKRPLTKFGERQFNAEAPLLCGRGGGLHQKI